VAGRAISLLKPGSRVVFSPGGLMVAAGLEALRPILERTDLLIVSRVEAEALTGAPHPEQAARHLVGLFAGQVLLTCGEQGVLLADRTAQTRLPAVTPERVVDTTGAGDAFSAGVICGLLEGSPLLEAARLGCAAAACKIQYFGARTGLPDRVQLRNLRQRSYS
jgi:sugar/nucleoside kinase (ribokinase family)